MKIEELKLDARIIKILKNNGYVWVEELTADTMSLVASIRGLSAEDVEAIDNALAKIGAKFAEEEYQEDFEEEFSL